MKITRLTPALIAIALLFAMTADATPTESQKGGGTIQGVVENRWIAKFPIAVYIEEMPGKKFSPPEKHPVMDQKGKEFTPRLLPVLIGSTVDFHNSDNFEHNVFSPDGEKYELGNWGLEGKKSYTFNKIPEKKTLGVYTQLCKLHPEMIGYVLVVKTPYAAVTDQEGHFKIANVPTGTWKLKVWGERLKKAQLEKTFEVTVEEGKEVAVKIQP